MLQVDEHFWFRWIEDVAEARRRSRIDNPATDRCARGAQHAIVKVLARPRCELGIHPVGFIQHRIETTIDQHTKDRVTERATTLACRQHRRKLLLVADEDEALCGEHAHYRQWQGNLAGFVENNSIELNTAEALGACGKWRGTDDVRSSQLGQRRQLERFIILDTIEVVRTRLTADFAERDWH